MIRTVPHMHLLLYIGLGAGFATAAGLRLFLPLLVAGGFGAGNILGVTFAHTDFAFLQSGWWLVVVTAALVASYVLQMRLGSAAVEAGPVGAAIAGLGIGAGALLFAGTLDAHHDAWWAGLIAGVGCALLAGAAARPITSRTRARLPDKAAKDALTLYVNGVALVVAALSALLHPLGYVAVVLFAWLLVASRRRAGEKYAGLRILRD